MLAAARMVPPPAAVEMANPTLLVLVKTKLVRATELAPALTVMLPWVLATVADAVMTDPLSPKETLFEFENVSWLSVLLAVPALNRRNAVAEMVPSPAPVDSDQLMALLSAKMSREPMTELPP